MRHAVKTQLCITGEAQSRLAVTGVRQRLHPHDGAIDGVLERISAGLAVAVDALCRFLP